MPTGEECRRSIEFNSRKNTIASCAKRERKQGKKHPIATRHTSLSVSGRRKKILALTATAAADPLRILTFCVAFRHCERTSKTVCVRCVCVCVCLARIVSRNEIVNAIDEASPWQSSCHGAGDDDERTIITVPPHQRTINFQWVRASHVDSMKRVYTHINGIRLHRVHTSDSVGR